MAEVRRDVPAVRGHDGRDGVVRDDHLEQADAAEGGDNADQRTDSPWDEHLSMLNVTTKTFGVGERGWVGRTVTVRQVAARWCRFVRLDGNGSII